MDNRDDEIDSSLATTKPGDREWQDDGLDWAPPEPDHAEEPATYTLLADGVVLLRYRAEGVAVSCYVTRDGSLPLPAADFSRSEIREGITLSTRDEDKADCFSCAAWQEDGLSFRLETDDPVPAETLLRLVGSLT